MPLTMFALHRDGVHRLVRWEHSVMVLLTPDRRYVIGNNGWTRGVRRGKVNELPRMVKKF